MSVNLSEITITPDEGVKHALSIYNQYGGVLIKGLFKNEVDKLNDDLEPHMCQREPGIEHEWEFMKEFAGKKTKRLTRVPLLSQTFREDMINNPLLLECINGIFDEVSDSAWLSTAQVIEIQPEEKSQYLHRDCDNYPLFRRFGCKMPDIMCNCIVALSEYTEEMGATRAIPGSHIWDDFSYQPTQEETIAIVMEKGDAFLFSGKTIHGGGTNISGKPRRAMAMAFNAGWLVPEEALPLVIPIEMAKTLTPQAQQLMGFRSFHNTKLEGGSVWTVNFEELGKYLEKNA